MGAGQRASAGVKGAAAAGCCVVTAVGRMWYLGLAMLLACMCAVNVHTIRVACELTMGADLYSVAVGADGNTTIAQLATLAGTKLVKKLGLNSGVVLSDLETQGAWLDPDDQLALLETSHGLSVEGQVVGLADDGAASGLVKDVASWRALVDDEGHWLHEVATRYGFSCTLGTRTSDRDVADVVDSGAEVHDVLEQLAQPTEPHDSKIDFWADEAMLILEQLRLGEDPLESEDTAVMPDTQTAAQIGDWLSSALAGTDIDGAEDEQEQWGGIILAGEEAELNWAQYEAEMAGRHAGALPVDENQVETDESSASLSNEDAHQSADTELDAAGQLGTDSDDAANADVSAGTGDTADDGRSSGRRTRSRQPNRSAESDERGHGSELEPEDKQLLGQADTATAPKPDANGCTTYECHYACPPGTRKTGLNQNCCGDGLCLSIENEERCPVDCAGIIVNGMIGPGTYVDPSVTKIEEPLLLGISNADERVPMARQEAGTMLMQDGKQALPVVWVQKTRIDEYRAQGFRTLENLLGSNEHLAYTPHPQQGGDSQNLQRHGIPFDPTKNTQAEVQADALKSMRSTRGNKRAWSTQMPTKAEIEQSKAMARRAAGAIQCNTCLFLLQDLWGKVLGVGANTQQQQAVHRMQFGTENDIIAAVEKMCGPTGSAAPFRGAYLLEEAKDCTTHPMAGCGHQGFSLRRRQPPLPASIVPLSWRTDALKLACTDLSNALDIDIAEQFYSLTNGKALYQLNAEELNKLKAQEKDMIVDLCSDRCVGLAIRSSTSAGQDQNGRDARYPSLAQQQHRLNQMNQPTRQSEAGINPHQNRNRQQADYGKQQQTQSAMHASVVVNAAINAAKHDQVPANNKARTVLDALEHRTLTAVRAKQNQEQQQESDAPATLSDAKKELYMKSGNDAAAKLLRPFARKKSEQLRELLVRPAKVREVANEAEQQGDTKDSTTGGSELPSKEQIATDASKKVQEPQADLVSRSDVETSEGDHANKRKDRRERKDKKAKSSKRKGRRKTASEEL